MFYHRNHTDEEIRALRQRAPELWHEYAENMTWVGGITHRAILSPAVFEGLGYDRRYSVQLKNEVIETIGILIYTCGHDVAKFLIEESLDETVIAGIRVIARQQINWNTCVFQEVLIGNILLRISRLTSPTNNMTRWQDLLERMPVNDEFILRMRSTCTPLLQEAPKTTIH